MGYKLYRVITKVTIRGTGKVIKESGDYYALDSKQAKTLAYRDLLVYNHDCMTNLFDYTQEAIIVPKTIKL